MVSSWLKKVVFLSFIACSMIHVSLQAMEDQENYNDMLDPYIDKLSIAFQENNQKECSTLLQILLSEDPLEQIKDYINLVEHSAFKNTQLTNFFCHQLVKVFVQFTNTKHEQEILDAVRPLIDLLNATENCDAISTLAVMFAGNPESRDYQIISEIIQTLLKKKNEFKNETEAKPIVSESKTEIKSTNQDVIAAFADLIHQKINEVKLEEPKNLLDAIVQLNILFRNIEVNCEERDFSFRRNGLLIQNSEIPSHRILGFLIHETIKKVLKENEKAKKLVKYIVEELAKKVTKDNKQNYVKLIENYLPNPVKEYIKREFAITYGWHDKALLDQKVIKSSNAFVKLFPIDSSRVVVASQDNSIEIWNTETGNCEKQLLGHNGLVQVFAYNDVNILASGSVDKTIKIWDINTDQCLQTLEGHTEDIITLVFINDTILASGSRDGTIRIWNITTGISYGKIKLNSPVSSLVKVSKNRIVSATFDGNISCWEINVPNATPLINFTINETSRLFILKNKMFAVVSSDGTINFRDNKNNARTLGSSSLIRHSDRVNKVISINDNTLASCSSDKTIKIWDVTPGHFKKYYCGTLSGHTNQVTNLEVLNDTIIVSASLYHGDGTVKIWNANTWKCLQTFDSYEKTFRQSALVTTDNTIVTCTGNTLRIIDMPTFEKTINFVAQQNSEKNKQTGNWSPLSSWFK